MGRCWPKEKTRNTEINQEPALRFLAKAAMFGDIGCALKNSGDNHSCTPGFVKFL